MALEIDRVTKRFGTLPAVQSVSLIVAPGEFLALLGPSGSGKTTLLRVVGGLDLPEDGSLRFDGQEITHTPARERTSASSFRTTLCFAT